MAPHYTRRDALALAGAFAATVTLPVQQALAADTAPAAGAGDPTVNFLAVGDWGERGSPPQRRVATAMATAAESQKSDFIISLGDNFYPKGVANVTDSHWQDSFESVYAAPSLQVPWYPILGNHDRNGEAMAQVAYSQLSNRWRMPGTYYWHGERLSDGSRADFFFLDTSMIIEENSGIHSFVPGDDADDQMAWLEQALGASTASWKIVVGHHPLFSGGPHGGAPELVKLVKPILDRHRVAVYLGGHDHNMQHVVKDNIHYMTCGTGATLRPARQIDGTVFVAETLGFLRAAISPRSMEVAFVDADGKVLHSAAIAATA